MNLLVIGKNSILCKFFIKHTSIKTIDVFSYRDISKINFKKYTHIVNFSYNPKLRSERYSEKYDIDLKIAKYLTKKQFTSCYQVDMFIIIVIQFPF